MIEYETIKVEREDIISKTCDVCKKKYSMDDWLEEQEFLHINFMGGYGSIFGDGTVCKADICQKCVQTVLGEYLRTKSGAGNSVGGSNPFTATN